MKTALNLLPPERKAALRAAYVFVRLQRLALGAVLTALVFSGTMLTLRFMLAATHEDLARRADAADVARIPVDSDVVKINGYLRRLDDLTARQTRWSDVMDAVATMTPADVQLARIAVSKDGAVAIAGTGRTRAAVLMLQDRLKASALFADVRSPISNILKETDVKFDFAMRFAQALPIKPPTR